MNNSVIWSVYIQTQIQHNPANLQLPKYHFCPLELILQSSPLSQLQSIYNHSVNHHFTPIRSNPEVAFSQVLLSIPAFHTNGVEGTCKRQIWRERDLNIECKENSQSYPSTCGAASKTRNSFSRFSFSSRIAATFPHL